MKKNEEKTCLAVMFPSYLIIQVNINFLLKKKSTGLLD